MNTPASMHYNTYNLTIQSELALPELGEPIDSIDGTAPQVRITFADLPDKGLEQGKQIGPFLWAAPNLLWLQVSQIATFQIRNGNEILIDPEPGIDDDSIRAFLYGSAFGALLHQRGYLVLHGNAIQVGNSCIVCVGPSGAGKSTLAAGFLRRGYRIFADDVVPVDHLCRVFPGVPRIKLWPDTVQQLQIETDGLRQVRPNVKKFSLPLASMQESEPLPVRWIYLLEKGAVDEVKITPVQGVKRYAPLYQNTYRPSFVNGMGLSSQHLQHCGKLAGEVRLAQVTRPNSEFVLEPLIDAILNDIEQYPEP